MSMVAFPFKAEDPRVATANLEVAARHPRVSAVVAVAADTNATFDGIEGRAEEISAEHGTPVEVLLQERIGNRRPGKGDGMNTAIDLFLDSGLERLHFYDADITNFGDDWIDGAEAAADAGYPVVRHYFPRASTDAMITWMVTRPLFALSHPASALWRIRQPLGGEILLTREVAASLAADPFVRDRSDWGIDTVITYATAASGRPIYESYVAEGKQHALYGSLADIGEMVVECFEAARDVGDLPSPRIDHHHMDPDSPPTAAVVSKVGYDVESTIHLLVADWSTEEVSAAAELPEEIAQALLGNLIRPTFAFLDGEKWYDALVSLRQLYRPEPGWRGVLFRLWVARVLNYTTTTALSGHAGAMRALEETVKGYAARAGS